ncbi:hypothetical protein COV18_03805 [Candidatus Woesearchaeota archaeon CG10_big_fil_rev_8_21_14_0_10_37_12]|nr:MAG: hypothetical protein COV18_03805 [Candidatus Woesearchaeota archaeon CG10_big_fil_rev_8_21_14_0_10_37_12]
MEQKNQPEKRFSTGAIVATLWKNNLIDKQGKPFETHSVSLERRYKDNQGNWKGTSSLRLNDLPKAALVLAEAYKHLVLAANTPQQHMPTQSPAAQAAGISY